MSENDWWKLKYSQALLQEKLGNVVVSFLFSAIFKGIPLKEVEMDV
jgi:hypothetical protein